MQVQGAIESLKLVTSHLAAWNLPRYVHVTVEPFLRPHADYFTGVAFQVHVQSGQSKYRQMYDSKRGILAIWPLSFM